MLQKLDDFDTFYDFMLENLQKELGSVLPQVADAYNLYHYEEKAEAYREARSRITRVQSRLLLLKELDILTSSEVDEVCREFESCVGRLNGLIRRMEESGDR